MRRQRDIGERLPSYNSCPQCKSVVNACLEGSKTPRLDANCFAFRRLPFVIPDCVCVEPKHPLASRRDAMMLARHGVPGTTVLR